MRILSLTFSAIAAVLALAGLSTQMAYSQEPSCVTVIDSRTGAFVTGQSDFADDGDTAGGTFTASQTNLHSFTLTIGPYPGAVGSGTFHAIVLGTDPGGQPLESPILWQSSIQNVPDVTTEFTFFPDVGLVVGEQYYVGMDNGLLTTASGTLEISINNDVIPGGLYWTQIDDLPGTWHDYGSTFDIASRIEMRDLSCPVCDIQLSQSIYLDGEVITADTFRFTNPSQNPVAVEFKNWLEGPGFAPVPIIRVGEDGSFVLPPQFDQDFGPIPFGPVAPTTPRGLYQLDCRMLDPVTGDSLHLDTNQFEIQ